MSRLKMASLLASNVIITGLGFVGGILVARYASVEDRGVFGEVLIWATLVSGVLLTGHVEYYLSKRTPSRFPFGCRQVVLFCVLTIAPLLAILVADGLSEFFWYALLFVPLNFYTSIKIAQITLLGRVHVLSIYKLVQPVGYIVGLIVLLVLNEFSIKGLLLANLASNFFLYVIIRVGGVDVHKLERPRRVEWDKWRLISLTTLIGVLASQFDRVAVSLLFSSSDVAHYLVGLTIIAAPLGVIGQATATLLLSRLVGNVDERLAHYAPLLFKLILVLIIVALIMMTLVPLIVSAVLGDKYLPIIGMSTAIAAVGIVSNFRVVLIRLMKIFGRNSSVLYAEVMFVVLAAVAMVMSNMLNADLTSFLFLYASVGLVSLVIMVFFSHREFRNKKVVM